MKGSPENHTLFDFINESVNNKKVFWDALILQGY